MNTFLKALISRISKKLYCISLKNMWKLVELLAMLSMLQQKTLTKSPVCNKEIRYAASGEIFIH